MAQGKSAGACRGSTRSRARAELSRADPIHHHPAATERAMSEGTRLYLLDTNVLMHDPTSLFRFEEHDIFLPMVVLEELDAAKKGLTEVARNVRQVSRFLGQMMSEGQDFENGLDLRMPEGLDIRIGSGKLFFQTSDDQQLPAAPRIKADNEILQTAVQL